MLGTTTFYDRTRGFGFITPDDPTLPNFFVHCRDIAGNKHVRFLMIGQRCEFDPVDTQTKPKAVNVRRLPMTLTRQVSDAVAAAEISGGVK